MRKKLGLSILYLILFYLLYTQIDSILYWIEHAPLALTPIVWIVATGLALFPIIPFPLVGAVIGATYGVIIGGIIVWLASTSASILMFLFVRFGFQDWGHKVLYRSNGIERVTTLFEKNAFMAILFARLIPFIPSIVINIYAALSRVSFSTYTVASALGKIPAMLLFALLGDQWFTTPRYIFPTIAFYLVFLGVCYTFYHLWNRKKP